MSQRAGKFTEGVGAVGRTARLPSTRCRPWEREDAELAARVERLPLAEFVRAAVAERARQTLNRT
jgi:hypothetical protein